MLVLRIILQRRCTHVVQLEHQSLYILQDLRGEGHSLPPPPPTPGLMCFAHMKTSFRNPLCLLFVISELSVNIDLVVDVIATLSPWTAEPYPSSGLLVAYVGGGVTVADQLRVFLHKDVLALFVTLSGTATAAHDGRECQRLLKQLCAYIAIGTMERIQALYDRNSGEGRCRRRRRRVRRPCAMLSVTKGDAEKGGYQPKGQDRF